MKPGGIGGEVKNLCEQDRLASAGDLKKDIIATTVLRLPAL
ncbi:hypothetical protein [Erwinia sorbitola]|nr:hypothetical protein [Erwinia sorbitola]